MLENGGGENESGPGPVVELIAFFGSTGGSTNPVTGPPSVTGTSPAANATRVAPTTEVTATFSEDMKFDTITGQTFKLTKKGTTTKIAAAVSYDASTDTAKLDPNQNLTSRGTYKVVVTTRARDAAGNPLVQQYRWFFTVG
jgi:Bacterial Ig-like domain